MTSPLLSSQGRKSKVIKRNIHVYSRAVMPTTENSHKTYFFRKLFRHLEGEIQIQYVLIFMDFKFLLSLGLISLTYLNFFIPYLYV